jgi:hypothetical protein
MNQLEGGATLTEEGVQVEKLEKRGGPRSNSGRPRRGTFGALQGDMDYAKNLISLLMRDHSQPVGLRARCALAVLLKGGNHHGRVAPAMYLADNPLKLAEVPDGDDQVAPELASEPEPG